MNGQNSPQVDPATAKAYLYGSALLTETEKAGNRLIISATITLVVVLYDVSVKSTAFFPFDFTGHPGALASVLSVLNAALLVNFGLRATTDLLRAREEWAEVQKFLIADRLLVAERRARYIDNEEAKTRHEEENPFGPDPWWEYPIELREKSEKTLREIEDRIGERGFPRVFWHLRLAVYVTSPSALGLVALYHSWPNGLAFLCKVLDI